MADIQHAVIPDAFLHEPKGVVTANPGTSYVANGSGSGGWQKIDSTNMKGLFGDGGNANQLPVSDGLNGFTFLTRAAYGSMTVTNNTNNFALVAAADATLATNTDYALYTGTGAPLVASGLEFGGVVFSVDRMTVNVTGVYKISMWAAISGYPSNTAKVAAKYRVNGLTFSPRRTMSKSNSGGDAGSLEGFGLLALNAGDYIQLYLASTVTGGLIITDMNTTIELVRAT